VTFNHGVEGSSPSALTKKINDLGQIPNLRKLPVSALCLQSSCGARVAAMDDAAMAAVALDGGGWIALLVLGVLGAIAQVRLVLRHFFPPSELY
jgi:hypothetical protein